MASSMILILVVFLVGAAIGVKANDTDGPTHVQILSPENFASVRAKPTLVKFFAPWCGHCKHLAPTWEDLAKEFNSGDVATIASVDCTVYPTICQENGIQGYPTLKLFHDGEITDYNGGRTQQAISKFIQEQLVPLDAHDAADVSKPEHGPYVGTESNFDALVSSGSAFVKFFAPWCGHCKHLAPTWEQLAETFSGNDSVKIVHVDCTQQQQLCSRFAIRGYPTLYFFSNGKKLDSPYQGARSLDALVSYVEQQAAGGNGEGHPEL